MGDEYQLWEFMKGLFALFSMILMTASFFSPVIISILTGNWWFMLLFAISWNPIIGVVLMANIVLYL